MGTEITLNNLDEAKRKIGRAMVETGLKIIASAFRLNPKEVSYNEMVNFISNKLGCEASFFDGKFYLVDFQTWKKFIELDWIENKTYVAEKFDCDNYSFTFSAHISELFDITVGVCYGKVYNKNTGKYLGLHYWNAIVTKEIDNSLHLYFYEPMNDLYTEVIDKSQIIIGNMKYEPIKITLF